jgi:hypothetical protein
VYRGRVRCQTTSSRHPRDHHGGIPDAWELGTAEQICLPPGPGVDPTSTRWWDVVIGTSSAKSPIRCKCGERSIRATMKPWLISSTSPAGARGRDIADQ